MIQNKCANLLGISIWIYIRYENDESKLNTVKYRFMVAKLREYGTVDEEHKILSIEQIKEVCDQVFNN